MRCSTCSDCRDYQEMRILEEDPYNWKKHFWFGLPDILTFFLKWLLILAVIEIFSMSMFTVAMTIVESQPPLQTEEM